MFLGEPLSLCSNAFITISIKVKTINFYYVVIVKLILLYLKLLHIQRGLRNDTKICMNDVTQKTAALRFGMSCICRNGAASSPRLVWHPLYSHPTKYTPLISKQILLRRSQRRP